MQVVSEWNYYNTQSAAWVDVGVYRDIVQAEDLRPFEIKSMAGFDPKKVKNISYCCTLIAFLVVCVPLASVSGFSSQMSYLSHIYNNDLLLPTDFSRLNYVFCGI